MPPDPDLPHYLNQQSSCSVFPFQRLIFQLRPFWNHQFQPKVAHLIFSTPQLSFKESKLLHPTLKIIVNIPLPSSTVLRYDRFTPNVNLALFNSDLVSYHHP